MDVSWHCGLLASRLESYIVCYCNYTIQSFSVACIFFDSCMFLVSDHGVLEIRWQMTGQVPRCITKISGCIVFVTLVTVFLMALSQATFYKPFSFKHRNYFRLHAYEYSMYF
jgi:hypothetical protein